MRTLRAFVGAVLGPIVIGVYYGWLRGANLGRTWEVVSDEKLPLTGLLLRGARGVVNASAVTIGAHIFCKRKFPSSALVRHELTHVWQWSKGRLAFAVRYGAEMATAGYNAISFEVEARQIGGV